MKKHIVIDTDIGGDPDDFCAFLLAFQSPEVQVDGIITSDEVKGQRVGFTKKILESLNLDIPVYAGIDLGNTKCLVVDGDEHEASGIGPLVEILKSNEYTYYVCIGPQSNLAEIVTRYPELKSKVELVLMGGSLEDGRVGKSEHNVRYDIPAAQKVLASGFKQKWITGEVTYDDKVKITSESKFYLDLKASEQKYSNLLVENYDNFWKQMYPVNYLHDPVALSSVFAEYVKFEIKKVLIDDNGYFLESKSGYEVPVSMSVDLDRFNEFFYSRIPL